MPISLPLPLSSRQMMTSDDIGGLLTQAAYRWFPTPGTRPPEIF